MLRNNQGRVVNVGHLPTRTPKEQAHRANILAPLREVLVPTAGHKDGKLFKLETRAKVRLA